MSPIEFQVEMRRRAAMLDSDTGRAVANACTLVERTAKQGMKSTEIDASKVYHRGSISHSPSVEFDYPAIDTGRLVQSVTHDISQEDGKVVGRVGTPVVYGAYLEFGTSKMSPRPWLKPSLAKNRDAIHALFMHAVKGESAEIGEIE
jgi:HK97 gp10 family phage protein